MASFAAWEDAGITEDHQPSIRYEWRPNVKEQEPDYDGNPEYLDTGQLLVRSWDEETQQWNTATHVAYCHVDAAVEHISDAHGDINFERVEA